VGDALPRGICGSGMIDLVTEMLMTGIIDQKGKFILDSSHPRMKSEENGKAYNFSVC